MLEELLERIDQKEFELLADSIKQSLAEHRKWMHAISVAIVSRESISTNVFIAEDAHKHCSFGKWMNRFLTDPIFNTAHSSKLNNCMSSFMILHVN